LTSGRRGQDAGGSARVDLVEYPTISASADGEGRQRHAVDKLSARCGLCRANAVARVKALGKRLIPTTAIVAQTLVSDWLVEIEVIAAA
jgi:hypothetical protein